MNEFRARIGRVRMKSGGADVRVLHRQSVNPDNEDWRGNLVTSARNIAAMATPDNPLHGYVVLGIYQNGSSVGWRYDFEQAWLPRMMLAAWVGEIIRRDMISGVEARDVFNEMFEWREG